MKRSEIEQAIAWAKGFLSRSGMALPMFADWTLRDCDMQRAEIHETAMKGMNVTSCEIEGIMADIPSIRGMTVTSEQAVQLAALLGLIVQ